MDNLTGSAPIWTLGAKVPNLDTEIQFVEQLGGRLVLDDQVELNGQRHRIPLLRFGDKYLHLATEMVYEERLTGSLDYGLCHVVLRVPDVIEASERARAAGATQVAPTARVRAGFGVRDVAFFRSPGGILFELAQIIEAHVPDAPA